MDKRKRMATQYPLLNLPLHGDTDIKLFRDPRLPKLEWYDKEDKTLVPRNACPTCTEFVVDYHYATPEELAVLLKRNVPTKDQVPTLTLHHKKKNGHWPPQTQWAEIASISIFLIKPNNEYLAVGFDYRGWVTTSWIVMQPATLHVYSDDVVRHELKPHLISNRNMFREVSEDHHPGYWMQEPVKKYNASKRDIAQDVRMLLHGGLNNVVQYSGSIADAGVAAEFWAPVGGLVDYRKRFPQVKAGCRRATETAAALDFEVVNEVFAQFYLTGRQVTL